MAVFAVDVDGTIIPVDAWPGVGELLPGAVKALVTLASKGHKVVIWTCRAGLELDDVVSTLNRAGVFPDAVNDNLPSIKKSRGDSRKIQADFYLDDKSYPPFPGWDRFNRDIDKFDNFKGVEG